MKKRTPSPSVPDRKILTPGLFLRRSLVHYKKSHFWVAAGVAVSTAILVGALIIGDSVRFSLRNLVNTRLGSTRFALTTGDRFFRTELADELEERLAAAAAAVLETRGIAVLDGGRRRANNVRILGVDDRFERLGRADGKLSGIEAGEIVVNTHLAARLNLKEGDEILLRIHKPDAMPREAPLAADTDTALARRFRITGIVDDDGMGRFSLRANQVAPLNVFVNRDALAAELNQTGRANLLLVAEMETAHLNLVDAEEAVRKSFTPEDAGLSVKPVPDQGMTELRSSRIFIEGAVLEIIPSMKIEYSSVFTYFVNSLRGNGRSTPYSFVSAPGGDIIPADMAGDEILVNSWLAEDLSLKRGDPLMLDYYVLGPMRLLEERTRAFRVLDIVPLEGKYADSGLMPEFPGIAEAESSRNWNPGIPVDLDRIREKDEDYWDRHRGTPKAFVTTAAARSMWANRFGEATAVRFSGISAAALEENLRHVLNPGDFGFVLRDVRQEGLEASSQSVDFGRLFLGLSFFVILSALLLTVLLFRFNIENRSAETGILRALGFPRRTVGNLLIREGAVLVLAGGAVGGLLGILYNQGLLLALKTVWKDIVGTSALSIHIRPLTVILGTGAGMALAMLSIRLTAARQIRRSAYSLQKGAAGLDSVTERRPGWSPAVVIISAVGVILLLFTSDFGRGQDAFLYFFAAGILLLSGGMALFHLFLTRAGRRIIRNRPGLFQIGLRSASRRRWRSLTLFGLLACGLFIVFTVGANRTSAQKGAEQRSSGTGGFAFYGESVFPVLHDLNTEDGRRVYGLGEVHMENIRIVQLRVQTGDDASCLNLNRVARPRLLGIDPKELSARGAFSFLKTIPETERDNPWEMLSRSLPDGAVPAVADNTVIVWGLGKSVGDTMTYRDERGNGFKVRLVGGLANSIFQGNILIDEQLFMEKYPSTGGTGVFLVDAPRDSAADVAERLAWALEDRGLELTPAADRLAAFSRVTNTYLTIFLILGSFGLLLGSLGLVVVVGRNVSERLGELALMRAVGFSKKSVRTVVLVEHLLLVFGGILLGLLAALAATLPSLLTPGTDIPIATILLLIAAVVINGIGWTYAAVTRSVGTDLLSALRNE